MIVATVAQTGAREDFSHSWKAYRWRRYFIRSTNTISRATIFGSVFIVCALFWAAAQIQRVDDTGITGGSQSKAHQRQEIWANDPACTGVVVT